MNSGAVQLSRSSRGGAGKGDWGVGMANMARNKPRECVFLKLREECCKEEGNSMLFQMLLGLWQDEK